MSAPDRAKLVGINHVALEVDDVGAALEFYGRLFEFGLRSRSGRAAFIDIGDQFLALMQAGGTGSDGARHFGLVVDGKETARRALEAAAVPIFPGRRLDFLDPYGNRVEVVQYDQIQFSKPRHVLRAMGLDLGKTPEALAELREKGLGED